MTARRWGVSHGGLTLAISLSLSLDDFRFLLCFDLIIFRFLLGFDLMIFSFCWVLVDMVGLGCDLVLGFDLG